MSSYISYIAVLPERERVLAKHELAMAMAAVCQAACDEDDFTVLWQHIAGFSEKECEWIWKMLEKQKEKWDTERVIDIVISYGENSTKLFSVNTFIDAVPGQHYGLIGRALQVLRLRGRLETVGDEPARWPLRRYSKVKLYRFRHHSPS